VIDLMQFDCFGWHTVAQERANLVTLSQLDDFVLDTRGDLTILALQLTQLQELA
jgi:hypothetical protein